VIASAASAGAAFTGGGDSTTVTTTVTRLQSNLNDWFSDALQGKRSRPDSTHVRVYSVSEEFVTVTSPQSAFLTAPQPFVASLAVDPIHNSRLLAQQGRFMVTIVVNVEDFIRNVESRIARQHLFAAYVPVSGAPEALQDLAFMGLTAATMFPGLDGIALMIRHEMFYKAPP